MTQSTEVARGIPSKSLNKKNLHRLLNVLYWLTYLTAMFPLSCAPVQLPKHRPPGCVQPRLWFYALDHFSMFSCLQFSTRCCIAVQQSLANVCQASCAFRTLDFFPTIRHQSLSALKCPVIDCFLSRVGILTRDIDMWILSVCPSVTLWYCVPMNPRSITVVRESFTAWKDHHSVFWIQCFSFKYHFSFSINYSFGGIFV